MIKVQMKYSNNLKMTMKMALNQLDLPLDNIKMQWAKESIIYM